MGNDNPRFTRTRIQLTFCGSVHPKLPDTSCTRLNDHRTHCCDEVAQVSWNSRFEETGCRLGHDHSVEKGLVAA